MADPDWILERERRQMEQILELDMEELQVEEVDDDGSSSSSSVDTFLRSKPTPDPRPFLTIPCEPTPNPRPLTNPCDIGVLRS